VDHRELLPLPLVRFAIELGDVALIVLEVIGILLEELVERLQLVAELRGDSGGCQIDVEGRAVGGEFRPHVGEILAPGIGGHLNLDVRVLLGEERP